MPINIETSGQNQSDSERSVANLVLTLVSSVLLVVTVHFWNAVGQTVLSVTWDTQSLTRLGGASGSSIATDLWYLVNPASGTKTITVTLSALSRFGIMGYGLTGVDTSAPWGTTGTASGTGNAISVNITTTTANSWVLQALSVRNYVIITEGSGQTTIRDGSSGTDGYGEHGHTSYEPTTSPGTYITDYTLNVSKGWNLIHAEVKPVVAAGTTGFRTELTLTL